MLAAARLCLQSIDQIDDIEEAAACAVADEGAGDRDRQVALAGARAADENDIALIGNKGFGGQIADKAFIDGRVGEVKVVDVLCERQFGDAELVADGARLLLGDLGLQKIANDARRLMLPFDAVAHDLVIGAAHAVELQGAHQFQEPVCVPSACPPEGCHSVRNRRPAHGSAAVHRGFVNARPEPDRDAAPVC